MTDNTAPSAIYLDRLAKLRAALRKAGVQALVLPSADPHQSEYVAERWAGRRYFSGFSGSAGTAVVTPDGGGVWTDSRYFAQAPAELARTSGLPMFKDAQGEDGYVDWLAQTLPAGSTVGVDGKNFTVRQVSNMERAFAKTGLELRTDVDVLDEVWADRPTLPATNLFTHAVSFAGRSAEEKLADLRHQLTEAGLTHTFLSALDEIAWLLNIRASDISKNPLAIAYALVSAYGVELYTEGGRIDGETAARFRESGISVHPYADHEAALRELPADARVGIDEDQINAHLAGLIPEESYRAFKSPLRLAKAIKNPTEIEHLRRAHERDGVALVRAFRWLEHELRERTVRETEFADKLAECRGEMDDYYGESFAPIVAYGPNAALPHYHAVRGSDAEIEPRGILLVDSGGQYLDGTTDITRTFGLGACTEEMRARYTLVLKGHIALARAVFPEGTRGVQLDVLARQFLWQQGLNFGHGTGHGVGFFLNVHEPPQGFVAGLGERGTTPFAAGMLTSNEPGYYLEGGYGIRIENLVLAVPAFEDDEGADGYLRFETVTYYPIDYLLLEPDLLDAGERQWLNAYHEDVLERLSPKLDDAEREWLAERCGAL